MTNYFKDPYTAMFTGLIFASCRKGHVVLGLKEKEYNKHYDNIIIIYPTLRLNKTYTKGWIRHNDNVWLTESKEK